MGFSKVMSAYSPHPKKGSLRVLLLRQLKTFPASVIHNLLNLYELYTTKYHNARENSKFVAIHKYMFKNYNNCCILLIKYAIAFSLQGTITLSAAALTLSSALPTATPKSVILTRGISFSKSPMPITVCIFLR